MTPPPRGVFERECVGWDRWTPLTRRVSFPWPKAGPDRFFKGGSRLWLVLGGFWVGGCESVDPLADNSVWLRFRKKWVAGFGPRENYPPLGGLSLSESHDHMFTLGSWWTPMSLKPQHSKYTSLALGPSFQPCNFN